MSIKKANPKKKQYSKKDEHHFIVTQGGASYSLDGYYHKTKEQAVEAGARYLGRQGGYVYKELFIYELASIIRPKVVPVDLEEVVVKQTESPTKGAVELSDCLI